MYKPHHCLCLSHVRKTEQHFVLLYYTPVDRAMSAREYTSVCYPPKWVTHVSAMRSFVFFFLFYCFTPFYLPVWSLFPWCQLLHTNIYIFWLIITYWLVLLNWQTTFFIKLYKLFFARLPLRTRINSKIKRECIQRINTTLFLSTEFITDNTRGSPPDKSLREQQAFFHLSKTNRKDFCSRRFALSLTGSPFSSTSSWQIY